MPENKRIAWLDVARVLALVCVVGFHLAFALKQDSNLRPIGFVGASLFFIISGYTLGMLYPDLITFKFDWIWKRYARIASVYYPTLLAIFFLFGSQVTTAGWYAIVTHFLFLDSLSPQTAYAIISPAWFLVPLMAYYITFPFINFGLKKYSWLILVIFLASIAFRFANPGDWTNYDPLFFVGEFAFGIVMTGPKRIYPYVGALLMAFVNPIMVIPFIIFIVLSKCDFSIIGNALKPIAKRTLEIFLFHEAIINVIFGRWDIYKLDAGLSLIVLLVAYGIVLLVSSFIQKLIALQ